MEIGYRRTAEGSYMLIEGRREPVGFEEQMLKNNDIGQLLAFHTIDMNGMTQLWYDISGMRSFRDIVMTEGISLGLLYETFSSVQKAFMALSKFLIDEEHLLVVPDALFFSKKSDTYKAALCYCPVPHEDMGEQLLCLMRFVIGEVDHTKSDITALCYELYGIAEQDSFSFYDLMERLQREYALYGAGLQASGADSAFAMPAETGTVLSDMFPPEVDLSGEPEACETPCYEKDKQKLWRRILEKIGAYIRSKLPKLLTGKESLLPKSADFCDIQFDAPFSDEGTTVLLSEEDTGCRGRLLFESGGRGGTDIDLNRTPFSIGSKFDGNDAVLSSEAVSRYHARIIKSEGAYYVEDLNSRNGTFINGEIIPYHEPRRLSRMDMISFADMTYRVV